MRSKACRTTSAKLGVVTAEHQRVVGIGEEVADDPVVRRSVARRRSCRAAARRRWRRHRPCRWPAPGTTRRGRCANTNWIASFWRCAIFGIASAWIVPLVSTTVLPCRSRSERMPLPRLTSSLVPVTKIVGEKPTIARRSALAVVEPHSRSTAPAVDLVEAIGRRDRHVLGPDRPCADAARSPRRPPRRCRANSRSAAAVRRGRRRAASSRGARCG